MIYSKNCVYSKFGVSCVNAFRFVIKKKTYDIIRFYILARITEEIAIHILNNTLVNGRNELCSLINESSIDFT